jgi:hypothetical protein
MKAQTFLLKAFAYCVSLGLGLGLLEVLFRWIDAPLADRWIARGAVIASGIMVGAGRRVIERNRASTRQP